MRRHRGIRRLLDIRMLSVPVIAAAVLTVGAFAPVVAHRPVPSTVRVNLGVKPNRVGALDCNGRSPIQRLAKPSMQCLDPRGSYGGRFYDNGHYVGHDEPSIRFLSSAPGSGDNFSITETLPVDPKAAPTVAHPGRDVTHYFELSVAPWFSMDVCDPDSAPLTPCTPESDANAPSGNYPGAGAAFVELQFYPPGFAPETDNISCNNKSWCSALNIDSLECQGNGSGLCNNNCVEPVNFAFVQTNGVPTGPPGPQTSDTASFTPNSHTLMMNPGDKITVHMFDAKIRGGHALEVVEQDLTTGKKGFMIASAANGFMNTNPFTCHGIKFNFQPEYNTASAANIIPWGIGPYMINDEDEIGHFTPCTSVSGRATEPFVKDTFFKVCSGPYEKPKDPSPPKGQPTEDEPCFTKGDTHSGLAKGSPNEVTGCDSFTGGGDLDYDGTSYRTDYPDSTTVSSGNHFPTPFLQDQPTSNGQQYTSIQFMTDISASEFNSGCNLGTGSGCDMPPQGAQFYPYWTQAMVGGSCVWEFGRMTNGNSFGGFGQYSTVRPGTLGAFVGNILANPNC